MNTNMRIASGYFNMFTPECKGTLTSNTKANDEFQPYPNLKKRNVRAASICMKYSISGFVIGPFFDVLGVIPALPNYAQK